MKSDIWDKDFESIRLPSKEKIKKQIERYGGPVRWWMGRFKTEWDLEIDRKRILDEFRKT